MEPFLAEIRIIGFTSRPTAGREDTMEIYGFSHEIVCPRDAASGLPTA